MTNFDSDFYNKYLTHDPEKGIVFWKPREKDLFKTTQAWSKWNNKFAHQQACLSINKGYYRCEIMNVKHYTHRIIYIMETNIIPNIVDHINGNTLQNHFDNLRDVYIKDNNKNRRVTSSKIYLGVSQTKTGKWKARIKSNGIDINLGLYDTAQDAIVARQQAEITHGFHQNHAGLYI